jgi:hypothetical protein
MRAIGCLVLAIGCSFSPQPASSDAPGGTGTGSDAASAACVAQAPHVFGGHHYFATSSRADWTAAQAECAASAGHLVKIETDPENSYVTQTFAGSGYTWIGLHDATGSGTYVWADGSALGSYVAWTHVPSSGMCVDSNGAWDGYDCTATSHGGACECE